MYGKASNVDPPYGHFTAWMGPGKTYTRLARLLLERPRLRFAILPSDSSFLNAIQVVPAGPLLPRRRLSYELCDLCIIGSLSMFPNGPSELQEGPTEAT